MPQWRDVFSRILLDPALAPLVALPIQRGNGQNPKGGALLAAGADLGGGIKWTRATVIDAIRKDIEAGLPVNSVAMMHRNQNLYMAGRRRFGTWAAALEAAAEQ